MIVDTRVGVPMDARAIHNYFRKLSGACYKILPMWEDEEPTLGVYIEGLQEEMLGCKGLIQALDYDARFVTLLSCMQALREDKKLSVGRVKSMVFRMTSICKSLCNTYGDEEWMKWAGRYPSGEVRE